ncbi:unnamed protein product [Amoebophrya sp. A25]|nr:unnamed protein product [Amoebophrya sp. A25]|eukprot:GSA25T00021097001.1
MNPDIAMALREAYVALDIFNRSSSARRPCCVNTYSVRVAFSRTVVTNVVGSAAVQETLYHVQILFVMERMEQGDLVHFLKLDKNKRPSGPITHRGLLQLVTGVVQAVQGLHELQWTNGDIKPENFLIGWTNAEKPKVLVKIADFGGALPDGQMRSLHDAHTKLYADPRFYGDALIPPKMTSDSLQRAMVSDILAKPEPLLKAIPCDIWSVGRTLYAVAVNYWPSVSATMTEKMMEPCKKYDAALRNRKPDTQTSGLQRSWTWGFHSDAQGQKLESDSDWWTSKTEYLENKKFWIFNDGFHKWCVYRRFFLKLEKPFAKFKAHGFTTNFPPPFDEHSSIDLWTQCAECQKQESESEEQRKEREKQRGFYCFMLALQRYALNHDPEKRDLEKLKNSLNALETRPPKLAVLLDALPSQPTETLRQLRNTFSKHGCAPKTTGSSIETSTGAAKGQTSSFAQTNSRPSSEDVTTRTIEAEANGELQQLRYAPADQSQTFNSNADTVIRDEEASSSTFVSEEPEGPSSASAGAHYKVVHPHVQKRKNYNYKMNKKNKAGGEFNAFLELQGFVRNNFAEQADAEKDEPLIDVPVTKQEEDRDRDQPSASGQNPETSGGLGSGILEL